jgi:hypothetical protein
MRQLELGHSGRHRQRGVRFTRRGSRDDAAHQAAAPAAVVRAAVGGHVAARRHPDTKELTLATGYTRYKNVYTADGPVWAQSARQ